MQTKMMENVIIALDFGTSSVKAAMICAEDGNLATSATILYPWSYTIDGRYEIDPEQLWDAAQLALKQILNQAENLYHALCITFSFFGNGLLLVDKDFNPTTNVILASDKRATHTYEEVMKKNPDELVFKHARRNSIRQDSVPLKVLWIKQNQPDVFVRTSHLFDIQQFILAKLGLEPVNDDSMASEKEVIDVSARKWSPELLELYEIPQTFCNQRIVDTTTIVGTVRQFGEVKLPDALPVVVGAHDYVCGIMGLGAIPENDGVIADMMGTYDQFGFFVDYTNVKELPASGNYSIRGKFAFYQARGRGYPIYGSALDWFVKQFIPNEDGKAIERLFQAVNFDGSNRVLMVPSFRQENVAMSRITLSTTLVDLFCALIEGMTFESGVAVKQSDTMMVKEQRRHINMIRTSGGGSRTDRLMQLRASVFDIPVQKALHPQAPSVGAAVFAACALGMYSGFKAATDSKVSLGRIFEPDEQQRASYLLKRAAYEDFRNRLL